MRRSLTRDEVAALVRRDVGRIGGGALGATRAAVAEVTAADAGTDTSSEGSQLLRSIATTLSSLLEETAATRLQEVPLLAAVGAFPNAFARETPEGTMIVVFDGLVDHLRFFADLVTILGQLQQHCPDAVLAVDGGEAEPEALLFSTACFAVLADCFAGNRRPPRLHEMLGPKQQRDVDLGVDTAVLFLLLHEMAHIELGHLRGHATSELAQIALIEPEQLDRTQIEEVEADRQAIGWIRPEHRSDIVSSIIFLLGTFAFFEAFAGGLSREHPLAVNRIAAIVADGAIDDDTRAIAMGWIEDRAAAFRRLASERLAARGTLWHQIAASMPTTTALTVIEHVRCAIAQQDGWGAA